MIHQVQYSVKQKLCAVLFGSSLEVLADKIDFCSRFRREEAMEESTLLRSVLKSGDAAGRIVFFLGVELLRFRFLPAARDCRRILAPHIEHLIRITPIPRWPPESSPLRIPDPDHFELLIRLPYQLFSIYGEVGIPRIFGCSLSDCLTTPLLLCGRYSRYPKSCYGPPRHYDPLAATSCSVRPCCISRSQPWLGGQRRACSRSPPADIHSP